jgi:hypothetical protein
MVAPAIRDPANRDCRPAQIPEKGPFAGAETAISRAIFCRIPYLTGRNSADPENFGHHATRNSGNIL